MIDYSWVPWFRELVRKVEESGATDLVEKAKAVDWQTDDPTILRYRDDNIDPFSFFYSLSSRLGDVKFISRLRSVQDVFSLKTACPEHRPHIPGGDPRNLLFHHRDGKPDLLWSLFRQASAEVPDIIGEDFDGTLNIRNVAIAKLTQTLFIINPDHFLPADTTTRLPMPEFKVQPGDYSEYAARLDAIKALFPGCAPYEINTFLDIQGKEPLIGPETRFFQVSTDVNDDGTDHWAEFERTNSVWAQAGKTRSGVSDGLESAKRGDVILVRFGSSGRGIGVVEEGGYAGGGWSEDARISVYWVNKRDAEFANVTGQHGSEPTQAQAVTGSAAVPLIGDRRSAMYTAVGTYTPQPKQGSIIAALYNALEAVGGTATGASLVARVTGFVRPKTGKRMSESHIVGTLPWLVRKRRLHVLPQAQQQPQH